LETVASTAITVNGQQDASINSLEGNVTAINASIDSIEEAYMPEPFAIHQVPGDDASISLVSGTTYDVNVSSTGNIEDAVNGNIVVVHINGLVAKYAVQSATTVRMTVGYALDNGDTVHIKYVKAH
jgi:hypothetical protein